MYHTLIYHLMIPDKNYLCIYHARTAFPAYLALIDLIIIIFCESRNYEVPHCITLTAKTRML